MTDKLFVFTAGGPEAYQHYIDTIEEGFSINAIKQFLSENELGIIQKIYGDGKIRSWGAIPGPQNFYSWDWLLEQF